MKCSPKISEYFDLLEKGCKQAFSIASSARKKGLDPTSQVEIGLAKNMAERVIGIISVAAPQIVGSGAEKRIIELEEEYGAQDWRVALKIAEEVARESFCKFKDKKEAMEIGIRTGFTYATVGVVSSPLEGFTSMEIKPRRDGKGEYFCLNYAGPVRNAGGTAAAVSVLIGDYIRTKFGYGEYDPDEREKKRTFAELEDYHEYVTNLQYFPSKEESEFLMEHLPVEISGDPSEKFKLSNINLQDLPRVQTNLLRSGFCLIHSSCIPLKAPKLWKQLSLWGKEFNLGHWSFLEKFIALQKKAKSGGKKKDSKLAPDFTYIKDLVAGRPVISHPLRNGGFRLRYGRCRASGFSAQAMHPATMVILDDFVATATQLKVERPGKAAAFSVCNTVEGPVVLLKDGSVLSVNSETLARQIRPDVKEILYLGDVLIAYGDFFDRAHPLVPAGYCPEWWAEQLKYELQNSEGMAGLVSKQITTERLQNILSNPLSVVPDFHEATMISKECGMPLHPRYTFFWKSISPVDLEALVDYLLSGNISCQKIVLPLRQAWQKGKRSLELLAVPHKTINNEFIVISAPYAESLLFMLGVPNTLCSSTKIQIIEKSGDAAKCGLGVFSTADLEKSGNPGHEGAKIFSLKPNDAASLNQHNENIAIKEALLDSKNKIQAILHSVQDAVDSSLKNKEATGRDETQGKDALGIICTLCPAVIKDLAGVFIGSRMGRPEKAKMRKMVGSPHTLFPVGAEGGRLRSFQAALEAKKITSEFPIYHCEGCKKDVVFGICPFCGKQAKKKMLCPTCGISDSCTHEGSQSYRRQPIDINEYFEALLKSLGTKIYPDMIKGVKGTSNKEHVPEHLTKGILRAKHDIYVNKDGTTRYDCSELTLTHFKPKEIGAPIDKLISLGYTHDIKGEFLKTSDQVLELLPQDIVIPCFRGGTDEPCDDVLYNVAGFIDELLYRHYKQKPFYRLSSKQDLIGQLIIGLAPHTSAGILGRIIGFSDTQAFLAHPYFHAAMRRDCDGDESCIFLLMDGLLNFSKAYLPSSRGSTMDAPIVLTYLLNPREVDDMAFHMDIAWNYPLDLYTAAEQYKMPWEVKVKMIEETLGTEAQFQGMGYTHETDNINKGVRCSSYKLLPSMQEKLTGQMNLATKIRAVDESDVARLVIEKHFIRDTRGNLRKFSQQQFRCVVCNEKYRRPPLIGRCKCGGKLLFTISEGSITKYLEPSISLAEKYSVPDYLKQSLELTKRRIEAVFGKDKETQEGLGRWF